MNAPEKIDIPVIVDEVLPATSMAVSMGPVSQEALPEVVPALEPLTQDESSFCLAIIEYGGNVSRAVRAVYEEAVKFPIAFGHELLAKPNVQAQIARLQQAAREDSLISAGAHLSELARIRDLAIVTGNIKVAMNAERSRGEVAGFYQRHDKSKYNGNTNAVQININMASKHDENI